MRNFLGKTERELNSYWHCPCRWQSVYVEQMGLRNCSFCFFFSYSHFQDCLNPYRSALIIYLKILSNHVNIPLKMTVIDTLMSTANTPLAQSLVFKSLELERKGYFFLFVLLKVIWHNLFRHYWVPNTKNSKGDIWWYQMSFFIYMYCLISNWIRIHHFLSIFSLAVLNVLNRTVKL